MKHGKYLRDKRRRKIGRRIVSILSAIVVFVATYALILPAITLDLSSARQEPGITIDNSTRVPVTRAAGTAAVAAGGIDNGSPEEAEVIGEREDTSEEDAGEVESGSVQQGDDSSGDVNSAESTDGKEYDVDTAADTGGDNIYSAPETEITETGSAETEETGSENAETENAETENTETENTETGNTETEETEAEKTETDESGNVGNRSSGGAETVDSEDDDPEDNGGTGSSGPENAEDESGGSNKEAGTVTEDRETSESGTTVDAAATDSAIDAEMVPEAAEVVFEQIITDRTGFYYYHADNEEDMEGLTSDSVTEWEKVENDIVLAPADFVRAYIAYTIPEGTLTETNNVVRYRLPDGLAFTDRQIEAINKYENGISKSAESESERRQYLGAEAVEGTRTPDERLEAGAEEYISATVKAEKIYKDGEYLGQNLIFTFAPYTVRKNCITYDSDGKMTSKGQKVKGFFTFDLTPSQIRFEKTDGQSGESEAAIIFVQRNSEAGISEIRRTLRLKNKAPQEGKEDSAQESKEDSAQESEEDSAQDNKGDSLQRSKEDSMQEGKEDSAQENGQEEKTLQHEGSDYTVTITYTEDSQISDGAELSVREIEKDTEEYASCLAQAEGAIDKDKAVSEARFFDITILVDGRKYEPKAPVSVQITFAGIEKTSTDDTRLLHYTEDEVQVVDEAEFSKSGESEGNDNETKSVDTVQFETDGFSVFGIVGTELVTEVILPGSNDTYVVTVTAPAEANIPKDAVLKVMSFEKGTEDYIYARNAVLADKKEKGISVDLDTFHLAALDISILDPEGNEIEPEAPVRVEIRIKELPGVDDLDEVRDSLEIQHHVESDLGVVVEKVFDGSEDASFRMDTNDVVSERGTPVDPNTVSDADFRSNKEFQVEISEGVNTGPVTDEEMGITASFDTPAFSTFTITWSGGSTQNTTTALRWRDGNQTRAYITVHYVDQNGTPITRPGNIGYTVDTTISDNGTAVNYDLENLEGTIAGYSFAGAYRDAANSYQITSVSARRVYHGNYGGWYSSAISFYNGAEQVGNEQDLGYNQNNAGDIYLVYSGNVTLPHTTVHYGYMDGNTFVEFEEEPTSVDPQTGHHTYLIYDFDGYQYAETDTEQNGGHTYYRTSEAVNGANMTTGATRIRESLAHNAANGWRYRATNSNNWTSIADGSHIYVVYSKKPDTPQGGTPKVKPVNPDEKPTEPSILKESVPNNDGTTNLSLSIRSSTVDLEVEKLADVIVVFDVSGSMSWGMGGQNTGGTSRLDNAKQAVRTLAASLSQKTNSDGNPLIRMGLISFSTSANEVLGLTPLTTAGNNSGLSQVTNAVNGLTANGGTNWEKALKLADEMSVDPERATFVIFVTDGDPTFRISRTDVTDAELQGDLNGWDNNDTYYWSDHVFGNGGTDPNNRNYEAALDIAQNIVSNNKNFYTIGISNDVTNLNNFADDAGASGKYTATSADDLKDAFDAIEASISALMGFSDIKMTDGITDLSNTVMEKASLLGVSDDFIYWKAPAPANWKEMSAEEKSAYKPADSAFTEWDPASENCDPASYNTTTGAVEWKMGPRFVPEDGCTYKVAFTVWPDQEAYDWIADLKNGTKTWQDVLEAGLDHPDGENPQIVNNGNGSYSLATNKPGANTIYKSATKSGDAVTTTGDAATIDFNTVGPVALAERQMTVCKRFAHSINSVSPLTKIQFTLLEGTEPYKKADGSDYTITLPTVDGAQPDESDKWEDDVYIAPGLIKTTSGEPGYQVLETGHDYSLTEQIIEGDSYEYKFTSQIVRPMVVGTELKYFVKKDAEYNTNPDNKKEYTIEEGTYYELDADAQALTGTNRKTAELDITKKVVDATGRMTQAQLDAETFTYKITLTVPEGADKSGIMGYEYVPRPGDTVPGTPERPRFTIFGYQTGDEGASPFTDDISTFRGKVYGRWNAQIYNLFGDSNTVTFYMTLDNDEMIRLTNLPQGTTYTITEYYANVFRSDQGAPSPSSDRTSNVAAQGYTVSVKQDGNSTAAQTDTITGTITGLDKRYYNQFTNTLNEHVDVELKARKYLDGYVWSNEQYYINLSTDVGNELPGAAGRTRFYRQFAAGTAGNADTYGYSFGKVRFTEAGTYKYYIAEDHAGEILEGIMYDDSKTMTIVISENEETHELYVESITGDDTTWDTETDTTMTTITNSRVTAKVKVLKIGDSGTNNLLSDVSFELYASCVGAGSAQNVKAKKADGTDYGTLTTGQDGAFVIDGLIPTTNGTTYYLVETAAKPGYNLLADPVEVTVYLTDDEPYYAASYKQTDYSASTGAGRIRPDEDGNCVITIDNKSGFELPHTGGSGTFLYTLSGLMLVIAAALMYSFRMRRRERRLN